MNIIADLFFFFVLNPFISPLPILNTDTAPVAHIISLFTFIYFLLIKKKYIYLNKAALLLLIFSLISFFFVSFEANFELRHRVGIFGAFLIYWFSTNFLDYFRFNILKFSILFHTFFVCFHFLLPSYFVTIASPFVRTIKLTEFNLGGGMYTGRGASGLAAENSFSAILGIVFIVLLFWFFKRKIISQRSLVIYSLISSISIILSFSATGIFIPIFMAFLYCFIKSILYLLKNPLIFKTSFIKLFSIFLVFIIPIFIYGFNSISSTRGINLLVSVFQNPQLLYLDSSIAERLIGISIGFLSLFHFPFGLGGGSYSIVAKYIDDLYNIKMVFPTALFGIEDTVSSFGRYSAEFGFVFIFVYGFLYIYSNKSISTFTITASTLSLLLVLQSFSILFPPTYLLLAVCLASQSKEIKNDLV